MKTTAVFVGGVALGLMLASLLMEQSNCCARVASGVRNEVQTRLGSGAVVVGDVLGIWSSTPGLLNLFGVPV